MAIDRAAERISAINQLVGLRYLFPTGSIDQDNRQASARTALTILAIPPIVMFDCPVIITQAISGTITNEIAIDAPIIADPVIQGTPGVNV